MADVYEPPRLRASTACVACNKKKVGARRTYYIVMALTQAGTVYICGQ